MQQCNSILICKVTYNWYQVIKSNFISNGSSITNCWYTSEQNSHSSDVDLNLAPGAMTLFLVEKDGTQFIVGGGFFLNHVQMDIRSCWYQYGVGSGYITFESFMKRAVECKADLNQTLSCYLSIGSFIFIKKDLLDVPAGFQFDFNGKNHIEIDVNDPIGMYLQNVVSQRRLSLVDSATDFGSWPGIYRKATIHKSAEKTAQFKTQLLSIYNYSCAVTGCSTIPALSLAHIKNMYDDRYLGVDNGLILRSDLHHLFSKGVITFFYEGDDEIVVKLSHRMKMDLDPEYSKLEGRCLRLPKNKEFWPNKEYLKWHNTIRFENWLKYGEFSLIDSIPMHPKKG